MRGGPAEAVDIQALTAKLVLKVFLPGASLGEKFYVFAARVKNGQLIT